MMDNLTQRGKIALLALVMLVMFFIMWFGLTRIITNVEEMYFSGGASPSSQSGALTPAQRHEVEVMIYESCVRNYNETRNDEGFAGMGINACGRRP